MQQYYYFVTTLPHINYGDVPPVSSGEFRDECRNLLEPKDAALVDYCCFNPVLAVETELSTGSAFIDMHMAWERTLALNLAYLRSAKLKRQSPGEPSHEVPRAEAAAKAAFEMNDPLQATLYIDRNRWGMLDALVGIDYFGVNSIYAHLMKLQLLERKQRFDAVKGLAEYRKLYDAILGAYNSKV